MDDEKYFRLTPAQLNLAFVAALGAVALAAFVYLGGVGDVKEHLGEEQVAAPPAAVTPVAAVEVTVGSAGLPANVRQAPTTEADVIGVIPLGIKATVVGEVVGEEAFAGSGIRIWYLVSAIPPDLPEDGFVYSAVVVR